MPLPRDPEREHGEHIAGLARVSRAFGGGAFPSV
jgi:hypothetical protein